MISRTGLLLMSVLLLGGCLPQEPASDAPTTAYDYRLLDSTFEPVTLPQMGKALKDSDVVFIGEYHGSHASHLLETQLLAALHAQNQKSGKPTILSMEMFSRDQQAILDDYLAGKIGERTLIDDAPVWDNYQGNYRPIVEYAKENTLPIIASDVPRDTVRCIMQQGGDYVDTLDKVKRSYVAEEPLADIADYEMKFMTLMKILRHSTAEELRKNFESHLARDNTMAESIARTLENVQGAQIIHLNGTFHSENGLGTVGALRRMNPALKISVITPLPWKSFSDIQRAGRQDDFYYLVPVQPLQFLNPSEQKKEMERQYIDGGAKSKPCRK